MFGTCRDFVVVAVYVVQVGSERNHVVVVVTSVRRCCPVVGFDFVFLVHRLVVLGGFHFVVCLVEQRRFRPVAVKCKERNVEGDFVFGGQFDVTFDVHTVLKQQVDHCLVRFAQGVCCAYRYGFACGNGHLAVVYAAFAADYFKRRAAVEQIALFGNVLVVRGGNAFRHAHYVYVVGKRIFTDVYYIEFHHVHAAALGVVPEFQLCFGLGRHRSVLGGLVYSQVSVGVYHVFGTGKSCALFTRRVRVAFLVESNGSRTHKQLVYRVVYLYGIGFAVRFGNAELGGVALDVVADKHDDTAQVGACHRGTAQSVVTAVGHAGVDFAAVCGDFRLKFEVGCGTPAGEVGHKGTREVCRADCQRAFAPGSQHRTVVLTDGDGRYVLRLTHTHQNVAVYIVVDYTCDCAVTLCQHCLVFKGVVATLDDGNFTLKFACNHCETACRARTGNGYVPEGFCFVFVHVTCVYQLFDKVVLFAGDAVALVVEENVLVACSLIGNDVVTLDAADTCNGQ